MNKAFMDQITNTLVAAQSAATSIGLAVKAEVPELCRQIIAWELWSNVAYGLVWLCVLAVCIWAIRKAAKWLLSEKPEVERYSPEAGRREFGYVVYTLGAAAFMLIAAIGICEACGASLAIIKCLAAPDLVILDYVKAAIAAVK